MENEFNNLKVALAGDLVLHCPDYDLPFKLETDASGRGVGVVLSQHFGDADHPIAYFFKTMIYPLSWKQMHLEEEWVWCSLSILVMLIIQLLIFSRN